MREVLVKVFGAEWYENYWPYVRYLIDLTKRAWMNQIQLWYLTFRIDDVLFDGNVIKRANNWRAWAYIRSNGKIVSFDLVDNIYRIGEIDERGNVNWIRSYKVEPIIST